MITPEAHMYKQGKLMKIEKTIKRCVLVSSNNSIPAMATKDTSTVLSLLLLIF